MEASPNAIAKWSVRVFGEFTLQDSHRQRVNLGFQKLEALVAMLVVFGNHPVERSFVGETLWPGQSREAQSANLRPALHRLRRIFGEDLIWSTRTHCKFSQSFLYSSDYGDPLNRSGEFMPGHEGPWFEDVRLEASFHDRDKALRNADVMAPFVSTLEWFSRHDVPGFFEMLKASPSLTACVDITKMNELLADVSSDGRFLGWAAYWGGSLESNLSKSVIPLNLALERASKEKDLELSSLSCLTLGRSLLFLNRTDEACRIANMLRSLIAKTGTKQILVSSLCLDASIAYHSYRPIEAAELIRRAEESAGDALTRSYLLSLRAKYSLSGGHISQAQKAIDEMENERSDTKHLYAESFRVATSAILHALDGQPEAYIQQLQTLSQSHAETGRDYFQIVVDEVLVELLHRLGESQSAASLSSSVEHRRLKFEIGGARYQFLKA